MRCWETVKWALAIIEHNVLPPILLMQPLGMQLIVCSARHQQVLLQVRLTQTLDTKGSWHLPGGLGWIQTDTRVADGRVKLATSEPLVQGISIVLQPA